MLFDFRRKAIHNAWQLKNIFKGTQQQAQRTNVSCKIWKLGVGGLACTSPHVVHRLRARRLSCRSKPATTPFPFVWRLLKVKCRRSMRVASLSFCVLLKIKSCRSSRQLPFPLGDKDEGCRWQSVFLGASVKEVCTARPLSIPPLLEPYPFELRALVLRVRPSPLFASIFHSSKPNPCAPVLLQ